MFSGNAPTSYRKYTKGLYCMQELSWLTRVCKYCSCCDSIHVAMFLHDCSLLCLIHLMLCW